MKTLLEQLRREAERTWDISLTTAGLCFVFPAVWLVAIALLRLVSETTLRRLTAEDGLVEWLQVLLFAVALLFSLRIAIRLAQARRHVLSALYAALTLLLLFIVGEELAWGQRALHFETPPGLAEINEKREFSLHNVPTVEPWFNVAKLLAGAYGSFGFAFLPWIRRTRLRSADPLLIIPFFLSSTFFLVFLQRVLRLTLMRGWCPVDFGESEELMLAYGAAVFTMLVWRAISPAEQARPSARAA